MRDEGKAWAFIDKLADRADDEPGTSISSTTVDGTRVVVIESDEDPLHLTIRDEYMLVGNSTDTLNAAFATIESAIRYSMPIGSLLRTVNSTTTPG